MPADLIAHLIALLARLDELAQQAADKGDAQSESYYYGVMFSVEIAQDDLAQIIADTMSEATAP
jgi:hypothetical protein